SPWDARIGRPGLRLVSSGDELVRAGGGATARGQRRSDTALEHLRAHPGAHRTPGPAGRGAGRAAGGVGVNPGTWNKARPRHVAPLGQVGSRRQRFSGSRHSVTAYSALAVQKTRIDELIDVDQRLTRVVYAYLVSGTFWLVFGTLVGEYLALKFVWPDLGVAPWLSFGRLRPVH